MAEFVFAPPPQSGLRVRGQSTRFPVHRIYCVGRNFAEHAREMGAEAPKGTPVFFMKPADAAIQSDTIPYPPGTQDLHHEVELVVALGPQIPEALTLGNATEAIFGYAVGLDLTRRDLQAHAKQNRLPWDTAKGFDASAPLSELVPAAQAAIKPDTRLSLQVNGELRQQGELDDMLFSVPEILVALSGLFRLQPGDLIFMGTPAGVAALQRGDRLHAELAGVAGLQATII